ncbi:Uncharacterised protein [Mycobacteroides abscessus subsp. abscessus]|nr:Uncharacterised protein [Mycobacteroides abscessus subsp. abscessus]SKV11043.1 Uncharacterised protein [Mycobacteroides abscessus subsp. abscessus]
MFGARPAPTALNRNKAAAIFMTATRPMRSATRPAVMAPTAAPSSAEATAKPSSASRMANASWIACTAPLITALSYPKRSPPRAATDAIRRALWPEENSSSSLIHDLPQLCLVCRQSTIAAPVPWEA